MRELALTRARDRVKLYGGGEAVDSTFALRSPIAGAVVERSINPGQELRADSMGNAPALFVVTDPSRLWLQLDATERELSLLRPGQEVRLNVTAYPDDAFTAHIDSVADFVDPQTKTELQNGQLPQPVVHDLFLFVGPRGVGPSGEEAHDLFRVDAGAQAFAKALVGKHLTRFGEKSEMLVGGRSRHQQD